nr:uncharacterized protein LOC100183346 [Ciona intestinalis]|eukprot:XP_002122745.1 uncharacterized protein LOC100183346 [Ciona intestinalis]
MLRTCHAKEILIFLTLVAEISTAVPLPIRPTNTDFATGFATKATKGLLIGCPLVTCLLVGTSCVSCCRRRIAQQKIRRFQKRSKKDENGNVGVVTVAEESQAKVDKVSQSDQSQSNGQKSTQAEIHTPDNVKTLELGQQQNNLFVQSSKYVTIIENQTYEDIVTSLSGDFSAQRHSEHYDVNKQNKQASEYENVKSVTLRQRKMVHAYETIECVPNGVKIVETLVVPEPIKIKRESKSQDLTIFPCQESQDKNNPDLDVNSNPPNTKRLQLAVRKSSIVPRASMHETKPSSDIGPSPYLLRTWSAPNSGGAREKSPGEKFATDPKRKNKRRFIGVSCLGETGEEKFKSEEKCSAKKDPPHAVRMRRRTKRKVRKTRRVLDEKRRKCIAARGQNKSQNDLNLNGGQNRWPLPRLYFDSSSGSDVFRFKPRAKIVEPCQDSSKREASLLEDIWCHLDEITQKSNLKESFSSRRASVSLVSSSEDDVEPLPSNSGDVISTDDVLTASRGSTTDRGYFTYKQVNKAQSRVLSSGISSLGKYSSFNSSRDDSLLGVRSVYPRVMVVPKITVSLHSNNLAEKNGMSDSYLKVLEAYFDTSENIYEELYKCVSMSTQLGPHQEITKVTNVVERKKRGTGNQGEEIEMEKASEGNETPAATSPQSSKTTKVIVGVESEPASKRSKVDDGEIIDNKTSQEQRSNLTNDVSVTSLPCFSGRICAQGARASKNYVVVPPSVLLRHTGSISEEERCKSGSLALSTGCVNEVLEDPLAVFMEMKV